MAVVLTEEMADFFMGDGLLAQSTDLLGPLDEDPVVRFDQVATLLSNVGAGIRVVQVEMPLDPTPALAIKKAAGDLDAARHNAKAVVEGAVKDKEKILIGTAGANYGTIIEAIEAYEATLELGTAEEAEAALDSVNAILEAEASSGEVAEILNFAHAYRSQIESTLGIEARRFASHLPAYRKHPELLVRRLWLEAYARVMSRADVEIV